MHTLTTIELRLSLLLAVLLAGCGGGAGDSAPGPTGTFPARVQPQTLPPFSCGPQGPATSTVMADLNYFWQSGVVACACQNDALANGCQQNAFVVGGTGYGYIFYDRLLLNSMDLSGSTLPADFLLAHEFGHNIQLALSLPSSGGKYKELQADCLGGFYVGSRISRGLARPNDVSSAFAAACRIGDPFFSNWWVQGAHGTCTERVTALQGGIDGYLAGRLPGQACPSL